MGRKGGGRGLELQNIFHKESKFKKKNFFCGGEGVGSGEGGRGRCRWMDR